MPRVGNELQAQSMAQKILRHPHPLPENWELERAEQAEEGTYVPIRPWMVLMVGDYPWSDSRRP